MRTMLLNAFLIVYFVEKSGLQNHIKGF